MKTILAAVFLAAATGALAQATFEVRFHPGERVYAYPLDESGRYRILRAAAEEWDTARRSKSVSETFPRIPRGARSVLFQLFNSLLKVITLCVKPQ